MPIRYNGSTTSVTLSASDIEIGAVEIKDGTTDNRAAVTSGGALATQLVDSAGTNKASINAGGLLAVRISDTAGNSLTKITPTDATATPGALPFATFNSAFNGTTWDFIRSGKTTPSSTFTGILNNLTWAVYHATPTTRTDGQGGPLEADPSGFLRVAEQNQPVAEDNTNGVIAYAVKPLAVTDYAWSRFTNYGANATLSVKAAIGNIKSLYCHNSNVLARYIQIHNTATVPSGGDAPAFSFLVPGSGVAIIDGQFFGENGANLPIGIAFAFSTTETTYTAGTAGDQTTIIMYK